MLPNPLIYGKPESWIDSFLVGNYTFEVTDGNSVEIKPPTLFNFGSEDAPKSTIYENPNTPLSTPLEKSIAYAGLGRNSPYNSIKYLYADTAGNVYTPTYTDEKSVTPFFLYEWDVSAISNNHNLRSVYRYNAKDSASVSRSRKVTAWESGIDVDEYSGYNSNLYIKPWTSFDLKSLVLCINVECIKGTDTSSQYGASKTFSLDEYMSNDQNIVDYPYLKYAEAVIYTISGDNKRTRYQTSNAVRGFNFAILDNLDVPTTALYSYNAFFRTPCSIPLWGMLKCITTGTMQEGQFDMVLGSPEIYYGTNSTTKGCASRFSESLAEELRMATACFGLFFTGDSGIATNGHFDDDDMYLGILENGIGNGKYSSGVENKNQEQWTWRDSNDSPFDPSKDIDDNNYSDTTNFGSVSISDAFVTRYAVSASTLEGLAKELYKSLDMCPEDVPFTEYSVSEYLVNSPIDCIVSVMKFPLNIYKYTSQISENIYFGRYKSGEFGYPLRRAVVPMFDLGSCTYFKHFDDFRDYTPYSSATLYIPFCGTVDIDPAEYMGHTISVKMSIDFTTGSCCAYILKDSLCVNTASGTCAIEIPVSGIDAYTYNSQIYKGSINFQQAEITANQARDRYTQLFMSQSSMKNFSITKFLKSVQDRENQLDNARTDLKRATIDMVSAAYSLQTTQIPFKMIGASSPATSAVMELSPRLILYRPKMLDTFNAEVYGKTIGYATLDNSTLSSYSGYTVATGIRLDGISATKDEQLMIESLVSQGVIV